MRTELGHRHVARALERRLSDLWKFIRQLHDDDQLTEGEIRERIRQKLMEADLMPKVKEKSNGPR